MSRFGRRRAKADENLGQGAGDDLADFPSTSEVTIVKPAPADHSDVLAELSAAFTGSARFASGWTPAP